MIFEGISRNSNGDFIFNWTDDEADDLMPLKFQKFNHVFKNRLGMDVYIAYKTRKHTDKEDKNQIGDLQLYIKNDIASKDPKNYALFLAKAVMMFDKHYGLPAFDVICTPKSSSTLNTDIAKLMQRKAGSNTILATDVMVKNAVSNITINMDKLKGKDESTVKSVQNMLDKAISSGRFKMADIFPKFRGLFQNFIVFNNKTDKRIFNSIVNGRILVIDDILTRGTTLREMNRILMDLLPKEIVYFILFEKK